MQTLFSRETIAKNTRIKFYPDKSGEYIPFDILCCSKSIFIPSGFEPSNDFADCEVFPKNGDDHETDVSDNIRRSFRRAQSRCFDLIMSNPQLDAFVTLTFSPENVDRYDYGQIIKKLNIWLDNRVRRHGLCYILVPELHQDGAIHFHGFMPFKTLNTTYSGVMHNRKKVYNITDFGFGYNTAKRITGKDSSVKTSKYIWKYMEKSYWECNGDYEKLKIGGRYFLHGGDLKEPKLFYVDYDYSAFPDLNEWSVENAGAAFRKLSAGDTGIDRLTFSRVLNNVLNGDTP